MKTFIKTNMLICLFHLIVIGANSQSFMHSAGVSFNFMNVKANQQAILFSNFTWFPRYTFMETEQTSFSIGVPIGAGVGIANSTYNGPSLYFGFDFPVVIDYNIGFKSSPDNENKPGFFIGTGFGYTLTNWTDGNSTEKLNSYGPIFRGGIRLGGGTNHPDQGTTIGLSYKIGLEKAKSDTYGIAVFYDF